MRIGVGSSLICANGAPITQITNLLFMDGILSTIFISMLPVSELRGAIPVAIGVHGLTASEAYVWAIIGNMIPVFFLLWFLPTCSRYLMKKWRWADKFFKWWFERTSTKTHQKIKKYGAPALILFVAIPLPFTGAWTGSVAAFLFDVSYGKALPLIFIGVLIAGVVVTLATTGVLGLAW